MRPACRAVFRAPSKRKDAYMRKFKTESKKLLDLMINSIYTNK